MSDESFGASGEIAEEDRGSAVERVLFAKVELWMVLLLVVTALPFLVMFGAAVKSEARGGPQTGGAFARAAYFLADLPTVVATALTEDTALQAGYADRLGGIPSGWSPLSDSAPLSGYLLFSRIDGDARRTVVELVDLSDFSVRHRWEPAPETLLADAPRNSDVVPYTQWRQSHFRALHPLLESDGMLVMHGQSSPLMALDACGARLWLQDGPPLHHSLNRDADGNYWAPGFAVDSAVATAPSFRDDLLVKISPSGEVLFERSLPQILIDHGLESLVFPGHAYINDPLHLNDVEPVLEDGPYWKKGDLFLSIREHALIVLYRPSTDEILWMKRGPWIAQHDVDIVGPTTISVFNNNVRNTGSGPYIDGTSNVLYYDFATDEVTSPFQEAFDQMVVFAGTNGLSDLTASGHLLVEEDTAGRFLIFGPDGKPAWQYMNRDASGAPYRFAWSRYVPREIGDRALRSLSRETCGRS